MDENYETVDIKPRLDKGNKNSSRERPLPNKKTTKNNDEHSQSFLSARYSGWVLAILIVVILVLIGLIVFLILKSQRTDTPVPKDVLFTKRYPPQQQVHLDHFTQQYNLEKEKQEALKFANKYVDTDDDEEDNVSITIEPEETTPTIDDDDGEIQESYDLDNSKKIIIE